MECKFAGLVIVGAWAATAALGCGGSGGSGGGAGQAPGPSAAVTTPSDWPADTAALLTEASADPSGDFDNNHPGERPPNPIPFPPGDVTRIAYGISGDELFLRVDFAAPIPSGPVAIPASAGVEAQNVTGKSVSLVLNADASSDPTGNGGTQSGAGASPWLSGVDLFVAISLEYGVKSAAYINFDFASGDIHLNRQQVQGVVGAGGPGQTYVIARYDISSIPESFLPRGQLVRVGSWVESESDRFHEMALDSVLFDHPWLVPAR